MFGVTDSPSFHWLWREEEKEAGGGLSPSLHTLRVFQFSVLVLAEPPWVYKHGGNVSRVCKTLVKHGRLWSSDPS